MRLGSIAIRALGAVGLFGGAALLFATASDEIVTWERFFGRWNTGVFLLSSLSIAGGVVLLACSFASKPVFSAVFAGLLAAMTWGLLEVAGLAGAVSYPVLFGHQADAGLGKQRTAHADIRGETVQDTLPAWGIPLDPISFHYRTDRHGLRNEQDRDRADLYVVGDSLIVSGLVPIEHTLPVQLERALERPVMSVALNGLGIQEQHALFDELALPVDGSLVLQAVFEGNDLLDSSRFQSADEPPSRAGTGFASNAVQSLRRWTSPHHPLADHSTCRIDGQLVSFLWTELSYRGLDAEIPEVLDALDRFRGRVTDAGAEFGVFFVPAKLRVLRELCEWPAYSTVRDVENPLREAVRAWSVRQGIPVLDLTEPLQRSAATALPWFRGDSHWNAAGQSVAAAAIADWKVVRDWRGGSDLERVPEVLDGPGEALVE